MKQVKPFYNSKQWKRKRQVVLKRDEYKCRECKRYGKGTPAKVVHHIFPLEDYPEHKLNSNNLISLCNACHEQMYDRVNKVMKEKGIQWMERMKDKILPPPLKHEK
jgi:5-methylcytosine-specific restriction enzyme A